MKGERTPAGQVRDYSYARQPRRTVNQVREEMRAFHEQHLHKLRQENIEMTAQLSALNSQLSPTST